MASGSDAIAHGLSTEQGQFCQRLDPGFQTCMQITGTMIKGVPRFLGSSPQLWWGLWPC